MPQFYPAWGGLQDRVFCTVCFPSPHPSPFTRPFLLPKEGPGFLHHPLNFLSTTTSSRSLGALFPAQISQFPHPLTMSEYQSSLPSLLTFLVCPSFIYFPIHLSVHLSTHHIHLSISLSNCPFIHLPVTLFIHSPICLSTCLSNCVYVHPIHLLLNHQPIFPSIYPVYIQLSICSTIGPFVHLLIHPPTHLTICLSVHPASIN